MGKVAKLLNDDVLVKSKQGINWRMSVGLTLKYDYNEDIYLIKIMEYIKDGKLSIEYNSKVFTVSMQQLKNGNIVKILEYKDDYNLRKNRILNIDDLPKNEFYVKWEECVDKVLRVSYNNEVYEVKIIGYNNANNKVVLDYKGVIMEYSRNNLYDCKLGVMFGKHNKDYVYSVGDKINDHNRDMIVIGRKTDFANNGKKRRYYQYKCNKCGFDMSKPHYSLSKNANVDSRWITETDLKPPKALGCSCCADVPWSVVTGINDIYTTDRWMVDICGLSEDIAKTTTSGSNKVHDFKCFVCGKRLKKKVVAVKKANVLTCDTCFNECSYPEKIMTMLLQKLNVKFTTQYSPDYLNRRKSDFYIYDYKLVIETDGKQHSNEWTLSDDTLQERQEVDNWKDAIHLENGKYTIRIDCFESEISYIKDQILSSYMNNIFDLSDIDWKDIDIKARTTSKLLEICDFWDNEWNGESFSQIGRMFNTSDNKAREYVKYGNSVGIALRKYDKTKMPINSDRVYNHIKVFKDNEFIHEFKSSKEMSENSVSILGIYFSGERINYCATSGNEYGGYKVIFNENKKNRSINGKRAQVSKNGDIIGVYPSANELCRVIEKEMGIVFSRGRVSTACRENKAYKGFDFKYV